MRKTKLNKAPLLLIGDTEEWKKLAFGRYKNCTAPHSYLVWTINNPYFLKL